MELVTAIRGRYDLQPQRVVDIVPVGNSPMVSRGQSGQRRYMSPTPMTIQFQSSGKRDDQVIAVVLVVSGTNANQYLNGRLWASGSSWDRWPQWQRQHSTHREEN